jgi:hypothetical protein
LLSDVQLGALGLRDVAQRREILVMPSQKPIGRVLFSLISCTLN